MKNKETFIIPKAFWTMEREFSHSNPRIAPVQQSKLDASSDKTIFDELLTKPSNVVFDFDDSKDRRKDSNKVDIPVTFKMSDFCQKPINCNFTFNQDSESKTNFNVVFDGSDNNVENTNLTCTWNGKFKKFSWYNDGFNTININFNKSIYDKREQAGNLSLWTDPCPILIHSNSVENLNINNCSAMSLDLSSRSIEHITADCTKWFELKFGDSEGYQNLKSVNLANHPATIKFNFVYDFELDSMNFDYKPGWESNNSPKNVISQLTHFFLKHNKKTKFIINPDSNIESNRFIGYRDTVKAKDIFKDFITTKNNKQQIEISFLDLIVSLYEHKKANVIKSILNQDSEIQKYVNKELKSERNLISKPKKL